MIKFKTCEAQDFWIIFYRFTAPTVTVTILFLRSIQKSKHHNLTLNCYQW